MLSWNESWPEGQASRRQDRRPLQRRPSGRGTFDIARPENSHKHLHVLILGSRHFFLLSAGYCDVTTKTYTATQPRVLGTPASRLPSPFDFFLSSPG